MEQTRPHISVYRWVSWMLLGLKCSCFLCCLKYLLASNSWESEGVLNNVELRSSHVSCSCVFFLWGWCSQTCQESRPQSTRVTPAEVCRLDSERLCAMEAIRFKSWSYIVICSLYMECYVHLLVVLMCNLVWSLMCSLIYVHLLMTLLFLCASSDSYGRRAELARTALFPTPCGWKTMRKFAVASKRKRISILLPKRCFRMGPLYESHKYLQYYASCWFLRIF